ncbi:ferredoxin--NADP reductase [Orrella daihaiensis]|uniref:ferredoxin--NADP(+) reductase n=1 Tax=Orrella daihaiensis TaxID=2782176 RepID=A0ABY4AH50_9BURK|nr:ferredoxin--NADP reductase [Orrella daihaiensis]UOD49611.1 ferredoxin--NADP reductase [Orrella daihaiensis]
MPADQLQEKYTCQSVLSVKQWDSPGLVSIKATRDAGFNFVPGQFARIGLRSDDAQTEPDLWRAYSMVSHPDDDYLEFFSVTVPDGQFSPKLAALQENDKLWIEKAPFGFLTLERFLPAKALWLVSTGTGLSAYLPMLRDAATWQHFEKVIIVHGVRTARELAYRQTLEQLAQTNPQFIYLPVTSREPWPNDGQAACRVTTAYVEGLLQRVTGQPLTAEDARIMLCGNPEMVTEMRGLLQEQGFAASRRGNPGTLAVENYW